jgi:hypothetical protein
MKTTTYYASIDRNEPSDFEALILDSVEAIKDRQVAYCFKLEQAEAINKCFEEAITIEKLDTNLYAVYGELNNKARKDFEREARA